ncbi:MAG: hypothetical protein AAGI68_08810, partial [Planctomycetota bacterium]
MFERFQRFADRLVETRSPVAFTTSQMVEQLEPRTLFSAVSDVHLFYNDSAFDGRNAAINVQDDAARAHDKEALRELDQA